MRIVFFQMQGRPALIILCIRRDMNDFIDVNIFDCFACFKISDRQAIAVSFDSLD